MRAYFFGNYYLSSIQQGIQALHCVADMFVRYKQPSLAREMLYEWADKHKVVVLLNGGNDEELRTLYLGFRNLCGELGYPYETFSEDSESLNLARTCVGVVVPEKIYKYNEYEQALRKPSVGFAIDVYILNPITLNATEKELAALIGAAPLAR